MSSIDQTQTCEECGARLPAELPQGFCPRCLLGVGLGLSLVSPPAAGSSPPAAEPPSSAASPASLVPLSSPHPVRVLGDYELLEEIARGGMGAVYRARQISLNRTVAVKVLLFGSFASDEFVRRFRAEAEAAARLQHPNIVAVHEFGEQDGQRFFSMDYVEGQNLADVVREKPLAGRAAAAYLRVIADTIHYAHQRGILHRDLKPSNILLDAFDRPRVTDFGLAKQVRAGGAVTTAGQVLGSPSYMPPEQAGAKQDAIGPRSDVYSLGAILFHLLTGRPPFLAGTLQDTLWQVLQTEPVGLRRLNPSVPRDLETICLHCLEKDPERRYASAQALADDLGRFLEHQPIQARPARAPEKLWRWCRREPALAMVALLSALTLIGSIAAAAYFNQLRAEANRSRAGEQRQRYVAAVNVAQRNLDEGNKVQALEMLRLQIPAQGDADLRGFEWRYLWRQCLGGPSRFLPSHAQVVGTVRFSADGRCLGTYCWDGAYRVWDVRQQQKLLEVSGASGLGCFSADGASVLVGTTNGSIERCWLATGHRIPLLTNVGEAIAWSADGRVVALLEPGGVLKLRDSEHWQLRFSPPQKVDRYLDYGWGTPVVLSPDGSTLALIQPTRGLQRLGQGIRLWDTTTGSELPRLPEHHQIRSVEFSPEGGRLAVGNSEGGVTVWELARQQGKELAAFSLPVLSLAFSADGATLAAGSATQQLKLWDLATGVEKPGSLREQAGPVSALAFSPDGKTLASGSRNTPVWLWGLGRREPPEETRELAAHEWGNFAFSPNGRRMAAGCKGNVVKVWNVDDFKEQAVLPNSSYVVAFAPDGNSLLTADPDESPRWWNLHTLTATAIPRYAGTISNKVTAVGLAHNCRLAALGLRDGTIQLLEIERGRQIALWRAHTDEIRSIAFSPGDDQLVTGGRDHTVMVWDVSTRRRLGSNDEHKGAVCTVAMSTNGRLLASGCGAGTIKLWKPPDISQGSLASLPYHANVVRCLAFSPDNQTLASGGEDRTVQLWNLAARQQMVSFKHDSPLRLVAFAPDGNALATVTDEGTLRLFRAAPLP